MTIRHRGWSLWPKSDSDEHRDYRCAQWILRPDSKMGAKADLQLAFRADRVFNCRFVQETEQVIKSIKC
jgi:hypothetical protein